MADKVVKMEIYYMLTSIEKVNREWFPLVFLAWELSGIKQLLCTVGSNLTEEDTSYNM